MPIGFRTPHRSTFNIAVAEATFVDTRQRAADLGKGMSGRRPEVKGLVEALRTLRVRSCLRPVGAGNECPAGPDAGPHGSSPNQQNSLVMALPFPRASEPFPWFTSLRRRPRSGSPCGEISFLLSLLVQAATGRSS